MEVSTINHISEATNNTMAMTTTNQQHDNINNVDSEVSTQMPPQGVETFWASKASE